MLKDVILVTMLRMTKTKKKTRKISGNTMMRRFLDRAAAKQEDQEQE